MFNPRKPSEIYPHPDVGLVFEFSKFERPDERGVARCFEETSWKHFPNGGYVHQPQEFNISQEDAIARPIEKGVVGTMPSGAEQLTVRVKFHTFEPGESGEGEIHTIKLVRIRQVVTNSM